MIGARGWAIALALTACRSGAPSIPDTGSGGASPTAGTPASPSTGGTTAGAGFSGILLGPDGPLGDRDILLCNLIGCSVHESEPDGTFFAPSQAGWTGALKTHGEPDGEPSLAALLLPVQVLDEREVQLDALYVPELAAGVSFDSPSADPQTLDAGDGLVLTLNRGDLSAAPGTWLVDLAAARLPDDHIRPYPELGSETVVAVFALHPFGATSTTPIQVRAPVDLPAGTEVCFRSISDVDGRFSDPVPGSSDGSFATTAPGQGVDRLSWLVITTRP